MTADSPPAELATGPSLATRPALVCALAHVKAAAAAANGRAGHLAPDQVDAIVVAADRLLDDPGLVDDASILRGGGSIAVNGSMNATLARLAAGPVTRDDVNRSQSTADVVHAGGRLAILATVPALDAALRALASALEEAGTAWGAAAPATLARTCMQDALAVPTSLWPSGTAAAVERAREGVAGASRSLHHVALGSTVVGTGAGASEVYRREVVPLLAARTSLVLSPHTLPAGALQHSDDLVSLASAHAAVALRLIRVGQDLRLLTSGPTGGLGELRLAPSGTDSSFFAAKTNPVACETAISHGCRVLGHQATVAALAQQGELHLNVFDLAMAVEVLDQITALVAATRALSATVASVSIDAARCAMLAGAAHPTKEAAR